ncbi:hypothetical protein [Fictibacillus sp. FJAT-27399]|uniref:hypothetical protein n=1 Tax=Fictibacillus sp. FJAT-27399 TaxID=1729689 RepID=UPI000782BE77|nr:hypothetical protein [Fictibacillus sp. FJAT-27399]
MSEFMRAIVQEVLKSNDHPARAKQELSEKRGETPQTKTAQELYRPNYQKLNKEKRLGSAAGSPPVKAEKKEKHSSFSKDPGSELVSKLQVLSLSQGIPSRQHTETNHRPERNNDDEPSVKSFGKTKSGFSVWLYSNLQPETMEWFHRPIPAKAVAVFSSQVSSPGHLVIVQEWLAQNGDIKYFIQWDKNGQKPFLLELYHNDSSELEAAIRTLFQTLNHQSEKKIKRFYIEQPGAWLLKQLEVSCTRESLAIIEGMSRYETIALLLPVSANLSKCNIRFKIEEGYFLLYGPHQHLSSCLPSVYKMLDGN